MFKIEPLTKNQKNRIRYILVRAVCLSVLVLIIIFLAILVIIALLRLPVATIIIICLLVIFGICLRFSVRYADENWEEWEEDEDE